MNDYRITYTTEAGDSFDSTITERTDTAARKYFSGMNKGLGFTVTNVELIRENTCATKQQERETLAAIKKMVEELGPQSYLATAFKGCFEDAENNIENDFADSYNQRYVIAVEKAAAAKKETEELKTNQHLMQETIDRLQREKEELEFRLDTLTVNVADLAHLLRLAEKDLAEAEQRRDKAAVDIVKYADDPASEQFRQAVADHRNAQASIEAKQERLARLNAIKNAD